MVANEWQHVWNISHFAFRGNCRRVMFLALAAAGQRVELRIRVFPFVPITIPIVTSSTEKKTMRVSVVRPGSVKQLCPPLWDTLDDSFFRVFCKIVNLMNCQFSVSWALNSLKTGIGRGMGLGMGDGVWGCVGFQIQLPEWPNWMIGRGGVLEVEGWGWRFQLDSREWQLSSVVSSSHINHVNTS